VKNGPSESKDGNGGGPKGQKRENHLIGQHGGKGYKRQTIPPIRGGVDVSKEGTLRKWEETKEREKKKTSGNALKMKKRSQGRAQENMGFWREVYRLRILKIGCRDKQGKRGGRLGGGGETGPRIMKGEENTRAQWA